MYNAELCAAMRLHPITNRDDDVEIEVFDLIGFAVRGSCCKICNNSFALQLSFLKDIPDVPRNQRLIPLKKHRHLIQRQPDGFAEKPYFEASFASFGLIKQDFSAGSS
jgi:hypothetical protein